jgi:hypothetical protein
VSAEHPPSQVNLDPQHVFCRRHGEPLRATWPAGYLPFALKLFEAFVQDERTFGYARGDTDRLNAAIAEMGPLCCFVSEEALREAYEASGIAKVGQCARCREWKRGAAYSAFVNDELQHFKHVCFDCVVEAPPTEIRS